MALRTGVRGEAETEVSEALLVASLHQKGELEVNGTAFKWERDEWRSTVRRMTENDRHLCAMSVRAAHGMCGDAEDTSDDDQ